MKKCKTFSEDEVRQVKEIADQMRRVLEYLQPLVRHDHVVPPRGFISSRKSA